MRRLVPQLAIADSPPATHLLVNRPKRALSAISQAATTVATCEGTGASAPVFSFVRRVPRLIRRNALNVPPLAHAFEHGDWNESCEEEGREEGRKEGRDE